MLDMSEELDIRGRNHGTYTYKEVESVTINKSKILVEHTKILKVSIL